MQERVINISSINRQKIGRSHPEDFNIKFDPTLHLNTEMQHELAVDRVLMTYSWHNINAEYGNKTIKYSKDNGNTWKTITFVDGMYSYDDLNDYINVVITENDDQPSNNRVGIKIYFVLTSYRVVVELGNLWQLDLRNSTFGDLIGYEPEILTDTSYSTKLPNITNGIDFIHINCDIVTDTITDGHYSNTIAVIPTDNLTRSYPFSFEPKRALFSPVSKTVISEMRITLTDSTGRPIRLNGVDWYMSLILRSSFI